MLIALVLLAALGLDADASTTRDLERIEQQLAATWKAGDCAGWGAILAPEWSVIHITGAVISRAQALEMCKAPRAAGQQQTLSDISVRAFGNSAVVTGTNTVVTGGASRSTFVLRFTDVFVRRGGRWQVVASHATRVSS